MVVTKDSIIGDVLDYDMGTSEFFLEIGMHCLGCPSAVARVSRMLVLSITRMRMNS